MSQQNPRGVIAKDLLDTVVPVIEANAASIWAVGALPVHSVPGFSWSASGYLSVVNVNVRCDSGPDWMTSLGYSSNWTVGTGYPVCQLYDYSFIENNASPLVICNVFEPYSMSTPVSLSNQVPNAQLQIVVNQEVILASLVVKGASNRVYVAGTDYSYTYNDTTLQSGTIQIFSSSQAATESSFTVTFSKPNLSNITASTIIGGYDSKGNALGLSNIQHCYTDTGVVPAQCVTPGYGSNPLVFSAANSQVQAISNSQFRAVYVCDIDTTAVTNWTQIFSWKNSNNFVSAFAIAGWPKVQLGPNTYDFSTVYAVAQNVTTSQFGNIPYAVPSNKHNVGITGICLANGTPVRMDLGTANSIENYGVVTAVNDTGWTLLGDFTTDYPLSTQIPQMWTNERHMFNFLGNTLSLTLKQFIDDPGNQRYLALIGETIQQYLNHLVVVQAANTARVMFDPAKNLITNIEIGQYTYTILWTPPTPIRTLIVEQSYDVNGLSTWVSQITIPSIS
jgi:phage tail sheath protein FI